MYRLSTVIVLAWCLAAVGDRSALAAEQAPSPGAKASRPQPWYTDYAAAVHAAQRQHKMLLIYFRQDGNTSGARFESEALADPTVRTGLEKYVCARLPLATQIPIEGKETKLLDHSAFQEMLHTPGIAVIDFAHPEAAWFGEVVSTFPFLPTHWYTPQRVAVMLDLPPGTITERTLIYAVRVHPERPASSDGRLDSYLREEARRHAQYQADICRQGHHFWDARFRRICARLPAGLTAKEVCAESWPGQNLVEAAIECVRCWRLSSGHWSAVRAPQPLYAYDIQRGRNGVWYATGIFGEGTLPGSAPEK